jgi:hypothetical protein
MKIQNMKVSNVRFKDLSMSLKIPIIAGWIAAVLFSIEFLIGFYYGFIGAW